MLTTPVEAWSGSRPSAPCENAELAGRLQRRDQPEKNDHPVRPDVGPGSMAQVYANACRPRRLRNERMRSDYFEALS